MQEIAFAIADAAKPRLIDWVTLFVAASSLIIALLAAAYTKQQKDISERFERSEITTEIFDCLHIVKKYNGSNVDSALLDSTFKRLQKVKLKSDRLFTSQAVTFIDNVIDLIHEMPSKKSLHEDTSDADLLALVSKFEYLPIELLQDKFRDDYFSARVYLQKGVFSEFTNLFLERKS